MKFFKGTYYKFGNTNPSSLSSLRPTSSRSVLKLVIYCVAAILIVAANLSFKFETDYPVAFSTQWLAADEKSLTAINLTDEEVKALRLKVDSITQLHPQQIQALLLTEDRNFYTNPRGVSINGLGRFLIKSGGGSGLIQQLVKHRIHFGAPRSLNSKLTELIGSVALTSTRSKDELLLDYVNEVPLMNTTKYTYGMRSASVKFFGQSDLRKLNIAEWCTLVASLKGGKARPNNLPGLKERRDLIINGLAKEGKLGYSPEKITVKRVKFAPPAKLPDLYANCREYARKEAIEIARKIGADTTLAGYKITTTFSPTVQAAAVDVVTNSFTGRSRYTSKDTVEAACAAIDPESGRILAIVGDARPLQYAGGLNHANVDRNQVGSQFKPFGFAVYFSKGYSPEDLVEDKPGGAYDPDNYGHGCSNKAITARYALMRSVNKAAADLINSGKVTTQEIITLLQSAGFTGTLHTEPSMILGIDNSSPLELAQVYSIFPNGGFKVMPYCIAEIRDKDNKVIYEHRPRKRTRVLQEHVANHVTSCLADVVSENGTGANVRKYYRGRVAAKTGTQNSATDAWFTGFTSKMVISVWVGTRHNTRLPGHIATGGTAAAPVLGKILQKLQTSKPYYLKTNF